MFVVGDAHLRDQKNASLGRDVFRSPCTKVLLIFGFYLDRTDQTGCIIMQQAVKHGGSDGQPSAGLPVLDAIAACVTHQFAQKTRSTQCRTSRVEG